MSGLAALAAFAISAVSEGSGADLAPSEEGPPRAADVPHEAPAKDDDDGFNHDILTIVLAASAVVFVCLAFYLLRRISPLPKLTQFSELYVDRRPQEDS
eukprot:gene18383-28346_t